MKSQLFIPDKIRVGFQRREDTYTKKLAYVIYYGSDGKLRKETSWKGWCHIPGEKKGKWSSQVVEDDPELMPFDLDNKPHSGFVLNKGVQRYGYWGNGRNMIRVYDDRGIEFEITTDNLMFILMTTNCHKRGLEGEFVYAWAGKDLILLPTGCEEYKESVEYTGLQTKKIGAKDMVPGCAYTNKNKKKLIYLGRFNWYENIRYWRSKSKGNIDMKKHHIFKQEDSKQDEYVIMDSFAKLATKDTDVPVSNYAELIEEFSKAKYASLPIGFESNVVIPDWSLESEDQWHDKVFGSNLFIKHDENNYTKVRICVDRKYNYETKKYEIERGYYISNERKYTLLDSNNFKYEWDWNNSYDNRKYYTKEELKSLIFYEIFIKLDSGRLVRIDQY
jgi:hypothetical protein